MAKRIAFAMMVCVSAAAVILIVLADVGQEAEGEPIPEEVQTAAEEGTHALGDEQAVMLEAAESSLPEHVPSFIYIESAIMRAALAGMREYDEFLDAEEMTEETAVIIRFPDNEAFIYDIYIDRGDGEEALEAKNSSGGAVMRATLPESIPDGSTLIIRDPLDRENPPQAVYELPAEEE